jgi:hypothetical protein
MGPNAGQYEPRKASFYAPSRTNDSTTHEAVVSYPTVTLSRYIRFLRVLGREGTTLDQVISDAQCIIRLRRDSGSETIKPDWRFTHDGVTYGITSINPIPAERDEIELLCSRIVR